MNSEEYTALYHQYFAEFLDDVDITGIIDEAYELIKSYVEKDPTAFCTYEEFENGVAALRTFCELRTESVRGQLEGTIPSTSAGQRADDSALVDASGITISAMGSMGGGGGPGGGGGDFGGGFNFGGAGGSDSEGNTEVPSGDGQGSGFGGTFPGKSSGSGSGMTPPDGSSGRPSMGGGSFPGGGTGSENTGTGERPGSSPFSREGNGSFSPPGGDTGYPGQSGTAVSGTAWLMLGVCILVLLAGLIIALKYKRQG